MMTSEYNATPSTELKVGMFFKFSPNDSVKIILSIQSEVFKFLDLSDSTQSIYLLILKHDLIIIPRKDVIKKAYR